jgi:hypothetical protein
VAEVHDPVPFRLTQGTSWASRSCRSARSG